MTQKHSNPNLPGFDCRESLCQNYCLIPVKPRLTDHETFIVTVPVNGHVQHLLLRAIPRA